jgi:orotate phosphoribosyltransferase-like protein
MGGTRFVWTPINDAHLRTLREQGCSLSEMARELRTSRDVVRVRVQQQEAKEEEEEAAGPVVISTTPVIVHPSWFIKRGAH